MPTQIYKMPRFTVVRQLTGAIAADPAVLSDGNYPLASSIAPYGDYPWLACNWKATGAVLATDFLDVQLLYRNVAATARWIAGPTAWGIRQNEAFFLPLRGCSEVYLRVLGFECAAGTALTLEAATSPVAE